MSVLDNYKCEGQMSIFDLDIWSGKTYPEHLAVTKEKISEPSLKKRQKWFKGMPAFLDLRTENGHTPGASWEMGGALLGDYTMHSFGEYPKEENVSHLSQILEGNPHPKYCLSEKACQGILRRAENRGKKLPLMLKNALERQSVSKNVQENPGGGKGILIQNERTGALSTLNNQSVCCLNDQGGSVMGVSDNVSGTLRAQEHGHQPIVFEPGAASRVGGHVYEDDVAGTVRANAGDNQQAVVYGISAYESNAMKSANPHSGIYEAETARTLDLNGGSPACNQGGMAVVCLEGNGSRPSHRGDGYSESETMYTLNSTEHHAVAIENHPADSRVKISEDGRVQTLSSRMGTGGGNVPMVMEEPICATTEMTPKVDSGGTSFYLRSRDYKDPQIVCNHVVRRLTPLECERLQGYPDGWTDIGEWYDSKGKKHKDADSPRYKALGNSIALPFWHYMASKMVRYLDNPTMASLFDGIGGFPLVFSRCGCEPIWASEIEEFPIAVTKIRFP